MAQSAYLLSGQRDPAQLKKGIAQGAEGSGQPHAQTGWKLLPHGGTAQSSTEGIQSLQLGPLSRRIHGLLRPADRDGFVR